MPRRRSAQPRTVLGLMPSELVEALFGSLSAPEPPSRGDPSIEVMQLRLRALGLFEGEPDGRLSVPLSASLARFQKWAGLRATGDAHDPRTRLALRDACRGARDAGRRPVHGDRWPG